MTTTLLETYSIALEGTSDLNRRILKENRELQAEVKRLKGVLDMDSSLDDAIIKDAELIRELKADNKRLYQEHKECRLVEQVSSNRGNSSSTHTHTISKEIDDYMHHNPNCKGVRLFILPRDEFNDGEYDNTIYWEDGME